MPWICSLAGVVLVSAACSCASPRSSGVSITEAHSPIVKACPLGVAETHVSVDDTPVGADVSFTTTPDHVTELRRRVHDQAAIHGPDAHQGSGHGGVHGTAQGHGLRLWDTPAQGATEREIDGGTRLEVVAAHPTKVAELQARLRERVAKLEAADCP